MHSTPQTATLFVTCARGLENLLATELKGLGYQQLQIGCRGVYVEKATFDATYHINYCSRIASRVLWPLTRFRCPHREALYGGTMALPWEKFVSPTATFAIDANVDNHPTLRHSHFAALVVKDALCDRIRDKRGSRPSVDRTDPAVQLNLYIERGWATLSWDTSGQPLHKRGYRQEGNIAPLQENLAAALLLIAGYRGTGAFCDPMCGSGTLLIEAALIATNTPPGFLRQRWGFMEHPAFSQADWLRLKNSADQQRQTHLPSRFVGIERCPEAVDACRKNLRATGLASLVTLVASDCTAWQDTASSSRFDWIVANPPYGVRLRQTKDLASQLVDFSLQHAAPHAQILILTPEDTSLVLDPLEVHRRYNLSNGGIPIVLNRAVLPRQRQREV